jgi:hypothetical protein
MTPYDRWLNEDVTYIITDQERQAFTDTNAAFPFVDWTYRFIDGVGSNVKVEFVDRTRSGEFHLFIDLKNFGVLGPRYQELMH